MGDAGQNTPTENCTGKRRSTFMKNDSEREVAVFTEALKVPVRQRDAFLDRTCAGDPELRRKVEALLKAHDRLGSFMEEPPDERPAD